MKHAGRHYEKYQDDAPEDLDAAANVWKDIVATTSIS